jgi:hypothetical protein
MQQGRGQHRSGGLAAELSLDVTRHADRVATVDLAHPLPQSQLTVAEN